MNCDLKLEHDPAGWRHTCVRCGWSRVFPSMMLTLRRTCRDPGPSTPRKVWNFSLAVVRHLADGAELVSDEVIAENYAKCTAPCRYFAFGICTHHACGCTVTDVRNYASKLAWRSEHCPIGEWDNRGRDRAE